MPGPPRSTPGRVNQPTICRVRRPTATLPSPPRLNTPLNTPGQPLVPRARPRHSQPGRHRPRGRPRPSPALGFLPHEDGSARPGTVVRFEAQAEVPGPDRPRKGGTAAPSRRLRQAFPEKGVQQRPGVGVPRNTQPHKLTSGRSATRPTTPKMRGRLSTRAGGDGHRPDSAVAATTSAINAVPGRSRTCRPDTAHRAVRSARTSWGGWTRGRRAVVCASIVRCSSSTCRPRRVSSARQRRERTRSAASLSPTGSAVEWPGPPTGAAPASATRHDGRSNTPH